ILILAAYRAVQPRVGAIGATFTVKVQARQTLWSLATENPVQGASTSETVELIKVANGMTSSVLFVGQTIRVPCGQNDLTAMASR
ncbi:MAG: LysM peptidoglycan-binding domain-containing protein, partial [Coriobacteriia bacterium]|nr:LysM peptidoglycan-binding domain-containing protein [Coriobacteriia bacterium]